VEEALFLKESNDAVYIRAQGHVTANICSDLKLRVFERLESKAPLGAVYVDLSECEYMDSTFMGLLVGFNKRFLRLSERPITVLRPNETCLKLLRTIGVARLVDIRQEDIPFPLVMENLGAERKASARMLLNAHEDLIELSEENERKFSSLRTILRGSVSAEGDDAVGGGAASPPGRGE